MGAGGEEIERHEQGMRHAQDQNCRECGCTVNPFQFTVQRFKGSVKLEWSPKQPQFEMNRNFPASAGLPNGG
ncbi:hypothetical protein TIFTF001_052188 [Ficus carica]|uniref:Uncharacterized protein n=1 Tax=Ficus carica TaxID=3494 RepID=A0AA88JGB1_FICCA|nr:hypothetical protein TIFTF001_052188 [Ficus carica]